MPTIEPVLSILVPSIPRRVETGRLQKLLEVLEFYAAGNPVEVLCLIDNKTRSIGLKRQALLDIARGKFVAFVDDDDCVSEDYVAKILECAAANPDADCIVFDQHAILNHDAPRLVRHGIEFENTELNETGATRKPWHVMAYARRIAQRCYFPDASYGEDWYWVRQAYPLIKKQARIDAVLHSYHFSSTDTAAEHDFANDHPPEKDPGPEYARVLDDSVDVIAAFVGDRRHLNIMDLGCNVGLWFQAWERWGARVFGLDSHYMAEPFTKQTRSSHRFTGHDLRQPFYPDPGLPKPFSLVQCLEVAEHLPAEFADVLVDSICRCADIVVFSAATPGQGGHRHVNEQPIDYWIQKFEARRYTTYRGLRLPEALPAYYRDNMVVFRRWAPGEIRNDRKLLEPVITPLGIA